MIKTIHMQYMHAFESTHKKRIHKTENWISDKHIQI